MYDFLLCLPLWLLFREKHLFNYYSLKHHRIYQAEGEKGREGMFLFELDVLLLGGRGNRINWYLYVRGVGGCRWCRVQESYSARNYYIRIIQYHSEMSQQQFNLDQSELNFILPTQWLPRHKSNDSIFDELIHPPNYGERPLIFPNHPNSKDDDFSRVFKPREKKVRTKKPCDYRKNICGYITKKIIREYLSITYKTKVQHLCQEYGCDYLASKSYFLGKIEKITGPSHVPSLFVAAEAWQKPIKDAFKQFFLWFIKERYLRYLILQGKMQQKQAYIEYKNTVLISLITKSNIPEVSFDAQVNNQSIQ